MGREVDVPGLEAAIVKAIAVERAEFHSCTARQLSRRLGYHHSHISKVLQRMKGQGLVDYRVEIPGAIWIPGTVELLPDGEGWKPVDGVIPDVVVPPAPVIQPEPVRLGVDPAKIAAKQAERAAEAALAAAIKPQKAAPAKRAATKKAAAT